jgi:hypothetical protein
MNEDKKINTGLTRTFQLSWFLEKEKPGGVPGSNLIS